MPICINPKCGQVTDKMTDYCPHCGQKTLSTLNKLDLGIPSKNEISMENFEKITDQIPAKSEKNLYKKRKRFSLKGKKVKMLNKKKVIGFLLVIGFITLLFLYDRHPNLLPIKLTSAISSIEEQVITILPGSQAYKMGFQDGRNLRSFENTTKYLSEIYGSYSSPSDGEFNLSEIAANIKPISKKDAIEFAKALWRIDGMVNLMENSEKNQSDFVSGFLRGYLG